jgi:CAAX prenyl protease-like protein
MPTRRKLVAYTLPMLIFISLLALAGVVRKIDNRIWLSSPESWIYPTQTILCGALLVWFRREYDFDQPRRFSFAVLVGICVFALWIAPQAVFGFPPRTIGFNPDSFARGPFYWPEVVLRFARLVIVVPFVEEIFWRGFLLRFLVDEKFHRVRFGSFSWLSFSIVTLGFAFSHSPADWIAAAIAGALYNGVAYRTKSLSSCIFAHALTNLLLGVWIMKTKQWGFW